MRTTTLALCAALSAATLGPAPAAADTYVVNSTDDAVDGAIGNGACATAAGSCTLRAAIQEANAHAGADVVTVPAGLYLLALFGAGEDTGATGDLDVTDALEIDGAGAGGTIVDGLSGDRVFQSTATALTIRDLTMRHGVVVAAPGGALFQSVAGTVTIERVAVEGNSAMTGGAIGQVDGALAISDSTFEANTAASGGAVAQGGTGALTVTNTVFTSNVATGGNGGGVGTATTGPVTITGSTFSSNGATTGGGGIYAVGASAFSVAGCTIAGNDSFPNGNGGGLLYDGPGAATMTDTKVLANRAFGSGGASLSGTGTALIANSDFSDNVGVGGSSGAGLYAAASMGVTIQNTAARRNVNLLGPVGGILAAGANVAVTDVEVSENAAVGGGGLFASGDTVTLTRVRALRNSGSNSSGGGIGITGTTAAVSDSTIDGNVGGNLGGGLFASVTSLTLTGSTVSNNRLVSGIGGGLSLFVTAPSTLTNVTISGNVSDPSGGGMHSNGDITFRNVTWADNDSGGPTALYHNVGTATLVSSILTGGPAASACGGAGMIVSGGFNIDATGLCSGLVATSDRVVDPQLGPLADNGGPTLTHLPAASSPAIDGGNPLGCPATDQRGQMRPTDGNGDGTALCDVGAVEFLDLCPSDPAKTLPGVCGCGVPDTDAALPNGVADCLVNAELKARIAHAKDIVTALTGDPSDRALESELTDIVGGLGVYVKQFKAQIVLADPKAKLDKLAKRAKKPVKKVTKAKAGKKLEKARTKALAALGKIDQALAPQQEGTPG